MTARGSVLVVGGAGYVGSHACKALARAGFLPVVFDNLTSGKRHAVRWGPLIEGDAGDRSCLRAAFATHQPLAVMHFAARIEVGEGERDPAGFYRNNVAATLTLLEEARAAGVARIVFSSTAAVYGAPDINPIPEMTEKRPQSVYGRTKLMVEQILADYARAHGLQPAILRYFNAAGADPQGEIGEEHDPETHLIPNVLRAAAGCGEGLKVFGADYPTPDGTCVRDYVHVSDLASGHVAALERLLERPGGVTANLGVGRGASVLEIIAACERAVGAGVAYLIAPRRPGDVPFLVADPATAQRELGFKPRHSDIDTIVATAWLFHQKVWRIGAAAPRPPGGDPGRRVPGARR